jgi:microcystin-dependent protein
MNTNKCLILIVIIVLILLLIQRVMYNKKIVDEFQSGLLTSSPEQIKINNIINDILKKKMKTVKLIASDKGTDLLDDESPLGMISFFYQNPNSEDETIWIECNGQEIDIADYPDFFSYLNAGKSESDKVINYAVPNIIGRTIVGSGLVVANDDKHKNTNSRYSQDSLIAYHGRNQVTFNLGERGGVDSCPTDKRVNVSTFDKTSTKTISGGMYGSVNVCSNMSNMPPHIYLMPFMKVKNRKFTLSYKV